MTCEREKQIKEVADQFKICLLPAFGVPHGGSIVNFLAVIILICAIFEASTAML